MNDKKREELSILFSSFDKFSDLIPVTYHYFNKYWDDCIYNVYWGSNGKLIKDFKLLAPKWNYLRIENIDIGWSENLLSYLKTLKTKYVLLILDDFLFMEKPNLEKIDEAITLMKEKKSPYCRMNSSPIPDKIVNDSFGLIKYFSRYRSSLQPSIWERDFLISLVEKYSINPWQFEDLIGIVPESINRIFLGSFHDFLGAKHCIEKNKWIKPFVKILKDEGLEIDYSIRGIIDMDIKPYTKIKPKSNLKLFQDQIKFHRRKLLKKEMFAIPLKLRNN